MTLLRGLSGYVPIRNNFRLGYVADLAVKSLLPICDEVVVCDSDSDDGTSEFFKEWQTREPKLRVVNWPWPNPVNDHPFFLRWLNFAREQLAFNFQIQLDGDEVLDPESYATVQQFVAEKKCAWFNRLNLWGDPRYVAPHGTVCGERVVRLGPTSYYMPSDGWHSPEPQIRQEAVRHPSLKIFHLGFLRPEDKFFEKSKVVQKAFFNTYDARLSDAEKTGTKWTDTCPFLDKHGQKRPLILHGEKIPDLIKPWLTERGFGDQFQT